MSNDAMQIDVRVSYNMADCDVFHALNDFLLLFLKF